MADPVILTIKAPFTRNELSAVLSLLSLLDRTSDDDRHWDILIDDPAMTVGDAASLLRQHFPHISTHRRQ